MSPMMMLIVVWAVITVALIIVLIYRSTLSMHEDDQLFLDDSTSNLRAEQEQLLSRMKKVTPIVRILGAASGLLILVIAGMALWQRMNTVY
jgi:Tfp pilus assembly protein PilN